MRKLTATILATSMALGNCANIYAEDTNKNNTNTNIVSKSNTVNNEKNESTTIITTTAQVKIEKATEVTTEATTEEKKKVEVITEKAVQTTTEAGDIVLYSGDQMVVFYGSNSWSYTRLGHITDKTPEELTRLLSNGDVTAVLSIN